MFIDIACCMTLWPPDESPDTCSMNMEMGTLIIMGDFNAHVNGRIFVKPHDRSSVSFSHFLATNNVVPVNTLPLCNGA